MLYRTQGVMGSIPLSSTKIKQGVNSKGLPPFFSGLHGCCIVGVWRSIHFLSVEKGGKEGNLETLVF